MPIRPPPSTWASAAAPASKIPPRLMTTPSSPPPNRSTPHPCRIRRTTIPSRIPVELRNRALRSYEHGLQLLDTNNAVEARRVLTSVLDSGGLTREEAAQLRLTLTELSNRLVFSREVLPDDPFSRRYVIQGGDNLSTIPRKQKLAIDWRLLQRINGIADPRRIREGQDLKLVVGPFSAVVHKRDYRLDVYLGTGDQRVYVRSFAVGLGEDNSTPVGTFCVRENSRLINPAWTNPRTGEHFPKDHPDNPIGEHWIGLRGISENVEELNGYGIHGTVEPQSIGTQASMGCIRLVADDIALLYEMLVETDSIIQIVP
jgi:hypothetical protein